jgi:hypothetical protein
MMYGRTIRQSIIFLVVALTIGFAAGTAFAERQPHMHAALQALRNARQQLDTAEPDKGGHRVKAIQFVNNAISEVEAGMKFDNKH